MSLPIAPQQRVYTEIRISSSLAYVENERHVILLRANAVTGWIARDGSCATGKNMLLLEARPSRTMSCCAHMALHWTSQAASGFSIISMLFFEPSHCLFGAFIISLGRSLSIRAMRSLVWSRKDFCYDLLRRRRHSFEISLSLCNSRSAIVLERVDKA